MAKNKIQISLAFSADTSKAKSSLMELQTSLSNLLTSQATSPQLGINKELQKAQEAGKQLHTILAQSTNIDTGKFDLSKFNKALKNSGTSLKQLQLDLSKAGPIGEQTFNQLAKSIVHAEMPIKKMNAALASTVKSLKNTAQWYISSSVIHGFVGSIQDAYQYSQDLNRSLNDIRIVTGYGAEYMEKFAKSANKAAKSLSTTTNEYAKASLIYFQQGLSEEEVNARTEATIKMANVTGEAAEGVSSYMTAIWNNFSDGSKELTHYADTITALGAATAASSEEIAEGLQKFAAVANTVGLSYEYATTALATVVSQTRESADTIGTAFKTIFARLESLSLGDTLEDDTTLTKYSLALAAVGINIKDSNGALKDMDTIVDELGEKWQVINRDQQVALAQTVAGMRQYNNFIALMDNYDTFKVNLEIAENSKGTIDEQADIYAESWQAATNRVTAALESLWEKIMDDEFFIQFTNAMANTIGFVEKLIDTLGGLPGILTMIGTLLMRHFGPQLATNINSAVQGFRNMMGIGASPTKEATGTKKEALALLENAPRRATGGEETLSEATNREGLQNELRLQMMMVENAERLTEEKRTQLNYTKQIVELLNQAAVEEAKSIEAVDKDLDANNQELTKIKGEKRTIEDKVAYKLGATHKYEESVEHYNSGGGDRRTKETKAGINGLKELESDLSTLSDEWAQKLLEAVRKDLEAIESKKSGEEIVPGDSELVAEIEGDARTQLEGLGYSNMDIDNYMSGAESPIGYNAKAAVLQRGYAEEVATGNDAELGALEILANFENSTDGASERIDSFTADIEDFGEQYGDSEEELLQALQELRDAAKAEVDKLKEEFDEAEGDEKKQKKVNKKAKLNIEENEVVRGGRDSIKSAKQAGRQRKKDEIVKASKSGGASEEETKILEKNLELTEERVDRTQHLENITKQAGEEVENMNKELKKPVQIGWADRLVGVATSVTGIVSAVQMINSIFATWENSDMTFGEKMLSTLGSIAAIVPMLTMSFTALTTAIWGEEAATLASGIAHIKNAAIKGGAAIANALFGKSQAAVTLSTNAETGAVTANTRAWYANPIMWIALVIIGIVAAIALLIAGIVALTKHLQENSASWQLEQAKKEAEAMATALEEAKNRADELKQAFDEYNQIKDKLADCTKGTEEWNEALRENNAKVIELIQKYPQLVKAMGRGANGELTLNEEEVSRAIASANSAVTTATAALYSVNAKVRDNQIAVDRNELIDNKNDGLGSVSYAGIVAGNAEKFVGKTKEEIKELYYKLTPIEDPKLLDKNAEAIYKAREGIEELAESIVANTKATDAETEALKQSLLVDNKNVQNSEYTEQIIEATSQEDDEWLDARIEKELQNMTRWGKDNISQATVVNTEAKNIFEEYAKAAGLEGATLTDTQGNDDNRTFIYTDPETGQPVSVHLEHMKRIVAAARVNENITQEAEDLTKVYDKMDKRGAGMLTAATSGNTSFLSRAELDKIEKGKIKAEDLGLTEEDLRVLGFDGDLQKFKAALEESAKLANETWEKTLSSMSFKTQNHLTSLIDTYGSGESFAKITDAQLEAYGKGLDVLYENSGGKAADSLQAVMNQLISTNQKEADKIVEIASGIDWTNGQQGLIDLQNQLAEAGIYINETSQHWKELVNEIKNAPEALLKYDFEAVRKEIAEIKELVNDINFSDIITDEDFEKLKKYSAEVKDMFILTAEGYRFIGESERLVAISLENSRKALQDSLDNNRESKSVVSKVNAYVHGEQKDYDELSKTNDTQAIFNRAASFVTDEDITDEDLAALGFHGGKELLSEYIDKAATGDVDALTKIKEFYEKIAILKEKTESGDLNNAKDFELYASQFENLEDLDKEYLEYLDKEGLLTQEAADAYNKQAQYLYATVKQRRDNIDFMQEEEKLVERLEKKVNKLADKKDRAYGAKRLAAIDKEVEATYELIAANELALSQANIDKANTKADLIGEVGDLAKFDEEGNLLNSEEILDLWAEKGETAYGEVEKLIGEYDKAQETADGYADAVEENNLRIKDLALEKIEYKAEFVIELNEISFELLEWQLQHLEDQAYGIAEAIQLISQKIELSNSDFIAHETKIKDIAANKGIDTENKDTNTIVTELLSRDDLTDQERTSIGDAISGMMGSVDEMYTANEEMADNVLKHFQDLYDEYDKTSEKILEVTKLTSHYKNIIDIVGEGMTNTNKQFLVTLSEAEQEAAETQLKSSKVTMEGLQKDRENYLNIISTLKAEGADNTVISVWEEKLAEIDNMITQTQEDMQNAWTDALTAAAETFRLTMEAEIESFEAQMSGAYGTLDELSKAYEQQSVLNSQYVDDYEKIYKLSKITRQIENSMNNTSSIKAKTTLANLQAEITAAQQSGKELSEYDLEYLQKKYELKQAEIALEESQASSRTMRLTQDVNGNWGYTYTANVEAIGEAEQNYEDKLFAMQEYNAQQLENTGSLIISIQQEFTNALQEVYDNDTLSAEEKAAKIEEVTTFYTERLRFTTEEYDKIVSNNNELYTEDWTNYAAATGYMIRDTGEVNSALNEVFGEGGTAASYFNQFLSTVGVDADGKPNGKGMLSSLSQAYDEYKKDLEEIFDMAGTSLNDFGEKVQGEVSSAVTAASNAGAAIESLVKKLTTPDASGKTVFDKIVSSIKDKLAELIPVLNSAKGTIDSVIASYSKYLTTTSQEAASTPSSTPKPQSTEPSDAGTQTNYKPVETVTPPKAEATAKEVIPSSEIGKQTKNDQDYVAPYPKKTGDDNAYNQAALQDYAKGDRVTTKEGKYPWAYDNKGNFHQIDGAAKDQWDNKKARNSDNSIYVIDDFVDINGRRWARLRIQKEKKASPYYLSSNEITKLDTGGYTGSWGPEGRLAMLHQKEIILNADDTRNFLSAIDIVRELVKTIDLQAVSAQLGLSLSGFAAPSNNQTLQQEVTIHAEFPSVTDRNEIEEAFNSLITRTSQFITTNR